MSSSRNTQLVVCDLFDTLVLVDRPRPTHREAAKQLTKYLGCDYDTARRIIYPLYLGLIGRDRNQEETSRLLRDICDKHQLGFEINEICQALWPILGNGLGDHYLRPGAPEFLAEIRSAGYQIRLLSNCMLPEHWMMRLLDELDLSDCFHACHFSSSGRGKKPRPEFFELAGAGDFSTRWMLGDSVELDLEPAARLSWETVHVTDEIDWAATADSILNRPGVAQ